MIDLDRLIDYVRRIEAGDKALQAGGDRPHRVPSSRVLIDADRIDLLDDCKVVAVSWVRLMQDESGDAWDWPDDELVECLLWLQDRCDWAERQPWAGEFVSEIRDLASDCRAYLGERRPYRPPCPRKCGDRIEWVGADSQIVSDAKFAAYGRCRGCGSTMNPSQEIEHFLEPPSDSLTTTPQSEPLTTIPQIADELKISERTLRYRVQRKGLLPLDKTAKGSPLYRESDLRLLAKVA